MASLVQRPWQDAAQEVQKRRDASIEPIGSCLPDIPAEISTNVIEIPRKLLSSEDVSVTETPACQLIEAMASGKLSAKKVTEAFLKRATIAQKLVNCVYELLPDLARDRAQELDDYYTKHGKTVGPLHGLPISIKSHIGIKGRETSYGFVSRIGTIFPDYANIVKILLDAGAVLYVRTTEPQAIMLLETVSNVTGTTSNPHNTKLTPGGSSGGEAALQALHGSPLGVGGDIGGSIRCPAANCGLYGLKPTCMRLPIIGVLAYNIGCDTIFGTLGPLSPSLEGIELFMKTVLAAEPWKSDLSLYQMPWRQENEVLAHDRLNIGVLWDDNIVKPSASITRALKEVVDKLESAPGVTITRWEPYKHQEAMNILEKLYAPDGGKAVKDLLEASGEPIHDLTSHRLITGPGVEELTQHEVWKWVKEREFYRYTYLQEWNSKAPEMDVILCPAGPSAAPPHGTSRYWGYSSVWNLLDYPGISFPVTQVDPSVDKEDSDYKPRNDMDDWTHRHIDPVLQRGAPISLQLVGKKMDDEKVVYALKRIKQIVGTPFVDTLK